MRVVDLEQGSSQWIEWRTRGVGSADAAAIVGLSPWKTARRVWDVKTGQRPYRLSDERSRGRMLEPRIRAEYELLIGHLAPPICCERDDEPLARASLDGWVDELSLPVELKAPGRPDHELAVEGTLPLAYAPQCLHILLVTGAPFLHYVSWNDRYPSPSDLVVLRVDAAPALQAELLELERAFFATTRGLMPPKTRRWTRLDRPTVATLAHRLKRAELEQLRAKV